jgi:hypothetical protein
MFKYTASVIAGLLAAGLTAVAPAAPNLVFTTATGGALSPPVVAGNYLYDGTGVSVAAWDLSDPAAPVLAGTTGATPTPGPVRGLAVAGDHLYAVWNTPSETGGITIFSLANAGHPVAVGEFDDYIVSDYKRPNAIAVSGSHLYVGDADNGLVVLDISDPLNPVAGNIVTDVYDFDRMHVSGNQLDVAGRNFIGNTVVTAFDLTDPASPVMAGSASMDPSLILRATLVDGYAIGVGNQLQVFDLSDPANITQVFAADIDVATDAVRNGNALYLLGGDGLQVWDFSNPAQPVRGADAAIDAFAAEQTVATPFGAVVLTHADRGLVIGGADALAPELDGSFVLPGGVAAHAAGFDATHGYIAEEGYGIGVMDTSTFDMSGRYDADLPLDLAARDMEDIAVDGTRAYLASWGFGVLAVDISQPGQPVELGRFEFPFASTIAADGNHVYVASTTNGGIFKVLDVSDPASPQLVGSLTTSFTRDLVVRGNYAWLADEASFGDGGLRVVDISNPAAPTLLGQYTDCSYADGVDASADGNLAWLACSDDSTLRILDTSDKSNPVLVASLVIPGNQQFPDYNTLHTVLVADGTAYVGHEYGVDEIDVSDPANPVAIARHPTGFFVGKLERAPNGSIYAFAQEAGIYIYAQDKVFSNGFD